MLVARLPAGVRLTVVLDCCHSGSALYLPFVWGGPVDEDRWFQDQNPVHSQGDVQMFSGCEDDQCSSDVTVKGVSGGAMTNALCAVLNEFDADNELPTYPELMHRLHDELRRKGYKQQPRLSSTQAFDANKPFSLIAPGVPNQNPQVGIPSAGCRVKPKRELFGFDLDDWKPFDF